MGTVAEIVMEMETEIDIYVDAVTYIAAASVSTAQPRRSAADSR